MVGLRSWTVQSVPWTCVVWPFLEKLEPPHGNCPEHHDLGQKKYAFQTLAQ